MFGLNDVKSAQRMGTNSLSRENGRTKDYNKFFGGKVAAALMIVVVIPVIHNCLTDLIFGRSDNNRKINNNNRHQRD